MTLIKVLPSFGPGVIPDGDAEQAEANTESVTAEPGSTPEAHLCDPDTAPALARSSWETFGPPSLFTRTPDEPAGTGRAGNVLYDHKTVSASRSETRAPMTDDRIGALYRERDSADTKAKLIESDLERVNDALSSEKNPARKRQLEQLKTKLEGELAPQTARRDAADRALSTAYDEAARNGSLREQNANLYKRLDALGKELEQANKQLSSATAQMQRDVGAAELAAKKFGIGSPAARAAMKKAEASSAVAKAAEHKADVLAAAQSGLTGELQRRQGRALDEAKKANDPVAQGVDDVVDFASNDRKQQERVLGAPVVGVSGEQAAQADRNRIANARDGARVLDKQIDGSDARQQRALVDAATKEIGALAEKAQNDPGTAVGLLDALSHAQPYARDALADKVAKATTWMGSTLVGELDRRMRNGDGFREAVALEDGLRRAGKTQLADQLHTLRTARLNDITEAFAEANKDVEKYNADLARLMAGFGPMLDEGQRASAIAAFRNEHHDEYAAWEAAGEKLAHASEFLAERPFENPKAAHLVPDALASPQGAKVIVDALARQRQGKPSLLDSLPQLGKDSMKVATTLQTVVVKAVGVNVLQLSKTDPKAAAEAVEDIKRNARLFGLKDGALDKVTEQLERVRAGEQNAVNALNTEIEALKTVEAEAGSLKPGAGAYNVLKGLGLAFAAATGVERLRNNDDLYSTVKGSGEILGAGVDAGVLAMDVLGKSGTWQKLVTVGKGAGAATQALSAVLDGIAAVSYFKNGDMAQGIAYSATAVGGALLATAAFSAAAGASSLPGGQIVGGILVVAGTIAKWGIEEYREGKRENEMEHDAEKFLRAAGFDPQVAEKLKDIRRADGRNVGMFIQQVAPVLGMKPKDLLARLMKMSPDAIKRFVDMSKDLVTGPDGKIVTHEVGDTDSPRIHDEMTLTGDIGRAGRQRTHFYPKSLSTAAEWTRVFLGLPKH